MATIADRIANAFATLCPTGGYGDPDTTADDAAMYRGMVSRGTDAQGARYWIIEVPRGTYTVTVVAARGEITATAHDDRGRCWEAEGEGSSFDAFQTAIFRAITGYRTALEV